MSEMTKIDTFIVVFMYTALHPLNHIMIKETRERGDRKTTDITFFKSENRTKNGRERCFVFICKRLLMCVYAAIENGYKDVQMYFD